MVIPKTTNSSCLEPPDKDLKRFEQVMVRVLNIDTRYAVQCIAKRGKIERSENEQGASRHAGRSGACASQ